MAGQIPRHFLDDLLERIDIVDVVGLRVKLKKSGANHSACCPFHSEKTPSFSVSQTKQFYHCFGCGAHGNAITFLMEYENMHFVDAVETLAESIGIDVPREEGKGRKENKESQQHKKSLYQLMDECAGFYTDALKNTPAAIEYLQKRGLDGETATRYLIGYVPEGWHTLTNQFKGRTAELLSIGMLIHNEEKKSTYDRFRNRIMFPIRDTRGRVIGFGGRVMDSSEPKYLNSPETPLFSKGRELYGLHESRKESQSLKQIIVVEGYMDVVALSQYGIHNAVATLGTATNQQHVMNIFKIVPEVVFCFDGDRAGREAAWRALNATIPCLEDGRDAFFLFLPDGEDPDTIVSKNGNEGFQLQLQHKKPIVDFLFDHLVGDNDLSQIGARARLAEDARPLLEKMPTGVYRRLAQRRLEGLIGISLGSTQIPPNVRTRRKPPSQTRALNTMRRSILLLLQNPWLVRSLEPESYEFDQSMPGAQLLTKLVAICDLNPEINCGILVENFRDTEDWPAVDKLAATSFFPDNRELDHDTAKLEFAHCIGLLNRQSTPREAAKVPIEVKTGLLSIVRTKNPTGNNSH